METFVNLEPNLQPKDLVSIQGEMPDELEVTRLELKALPAAWHRKRDESMRRFGDEWISANQTVAFSVPSAVVLGEWNLLLNPAHPDFPRIKFDQPLPFHFDSRMLGK
jgi:RES domain-containing protein